jgi:FkbM family methyltransferase
VNSKALVRYFYSVIPGLATLRFSFMDFSASFVAKPEYGGARWLSIESGTIVDVGANRGQSTKVLRKIAPSATLVAFEPEPASAKRLASLYYGDSSVTVHDCALGRDRGAITLFAPKYGRWNCDGMAAADVFTATEWLKDPGRMYKFDQQKLTVHKFEIVCNTLDSYGLSPKLIKLHAQSAELEILMGASQTIHIHRPAIMCAFASSEVTRFLSDFGYSPYAYDRAGVFHYGVAKRPVTFTWYLNELHERGLVGRISSPYDSRI